MSWIFSTDNDDRGWAQAQPLLVIYNNKSSGKTWTLKSGVSKRAWTKIKIGGHVARPELHKGLIYRLLSYIIGYS